MEKKTRGLSLNDSVLRTDGAGYLKIENGSIVLEWQDVYKSADEELKKLYYNASYSPKVLIYVINKYCGGVWGHHEKHILNGYADCN